MTSLSTGTSVDRLVDEAARLRWQAPEVTLVLGERAVETLSVPGPDQRGRGPQVDDTGSSAGGRRSADRPDIRWQVARLRAESLVVFAMVRMGRRIPVVDRALRALRTADQLGVDPVAWQLRADLAVCARSVGAPRSAVAALGPVLTASGVPGPVRAQGLVQLAGCLAGRGTDDELDKVFAEADRLCAADTELDTVAIPVLRSLVQASVAAYHRRCGDYQSAIRAARTGLDLLEQVEGRGTGAGSRTSESRTAGSQTRVRLALELTCALVDAGDPDGALEAARPALESPVRTSAAGVTGWLWLAVASRVHLPAGRYEEATSLLREAAHHAQRHGFDGLSSELWTELAHAEELAGSPAGALECLHHARAARYRDQRARAGAAESIAEQLGAADPGSLPLADVISVRTGPGGGKHSDGGSPGAGTWSGSDSRAHPYSRTDSTSRTERAGRTERGSNPETGTSAGPDNDSRASGSAAETADPHEHPPEQRRDEVPRTEEAAELDRSITELTRSLLERSAEPGSSWPSVATPDRPAGAGSDAADATTAGADATDAETPGTPVPGTGAAGVSRNAPAESPAPESPAPEAADPEAADPGIADRDSTHWRATEQVSRSGASEQADMPEQPESAPRRRAQWSPSVVRGMGTGSAPATRRRGRRRAEDRDSGSRDSGLRAAPHDGASLSAVSGTERWRRSRHGRDEPAAENHTSDGPEPDQGGSARQDRAIGPDRTTGHNEVAGQDRTSGFGASVETGVRAADTSPTKADGGGAAGTGDAGGSGGASRRSRRVGDDDGDRGVLSKLSFVTGSGGRRRASDDYPDTRDPETRDSYGEGPYTGQPDGDDRDSRPAADHPVGRRRAARATSGAEIVTWSGQREEGGGAADTGAADGPVPTETDAHVSTTLDELLERVRTPPGDREDGPGARTEASAEPAADDAVRGRDTTGEAAARRFGSSAGRDPSARLGAHATRTGDRIPGPLPGSDALYERGSNGAFPVGRKPDNDRNSRDAPGISTRHEPDGDLAAGQPTGSGATRAHELSSGRSWPGGEGPADTGNSGYRYDGAPRHDGMSGYDELSRDDEVYRDDGGDDEVSLPMLRVPPVLAAPDQQSRWPGGGDQDPPWLSDAGIDWSSVEVAGSSVEPHDGGDDSPRFPGTPVTQDDAAPAPSQSAEPPGEPGDSWNSGGSADHYGPGSTDASADSGSDQTADAVPEDDRGDLGLADLLAGALAAYRTTEESSARHSADATPKAANETQQYTAGEDASRNRGRHRSGE